MNRILSAFLSLALLFSFCGCSRRQTPAPKADALTSDPPQAMESTLTPLESDNIPVPEVESEAKSEVESKVENEVEPDEPYVRVIYPDQPMVALTFDDGPHPVYSHMLLDTLEAYHGVATFFEVAVNIPSCPDALLRMMELGCEIGSHSNSHQDLGKMSQQALLHDLQTADEAFIEAIGQAPTLLRPPYGSVSKAVISGSDRSVITWNIDTLDWKRKDVDSIVSYVQSLGDLDGDILLMHSTYETTAEAVAILVPWLIEQGYQLVTVSELFAYYYGELLQPNQFYDYTYLTSHSRSDAPVMLPDPNAPTQAEASTIT